MNVANGARLQARGPEGLGRAPSVGIGAADLVFDTAALAQSHRFEAYRALFAPGGDVAVLDAGYRVTVRTRIRGAIVLHVRSLYGVAHERNERRVRRDAFDHFTLHAVRQGRVRVETAAKTQEVGPGEVLLLDMTRPFRLSPNAEIVTLSVPREVVAQACSQPSTLHGRRLDAIEAQPLMLWLDRLLATEPGAVVGSGAVEEALSRVLHAALAASAPSRLARPDWDAVRRDRARQLVEQDLGEAAQAPEEIAALTAMSRATLYRVFEPLGSVARWRQARRLWRFKAALTWSGASISASAAEAGLTDAAYATALFTRTFGCTPSAYRQSLRAVQSNADAAAEHRWVYANMPVMLARGRA